MERAGLTKATVFHYFPNKEAVLAAVFDAFGQRLELAAQNWFEPPPASHAARLEHLVTSLVDFYGRDPLNARILCHGLLETQLAPWGGRGNGGAPPVFDRFVGRFTDFVASGMAAGEFYPGRPIAAIMAIGGIILFEFMLPDRGREYRAGTGGRINVAERGREMAAVINRAVVRPGVRLRRKRPRKGKR